MLQIETPVIFRPGFDYPKQKVSDIIFCEDLDEVAQLC